MLAALVDQGARHLVMTKDVDTKDVDTTRSCHILSHAGHYSYRACRSRAVLKRGGTSLLAT